MDIVSAVSERIAVLHISERNSDVKAVDSVANIHWRGAAGRICIAVCVV